MLRAKSRRIRLKVQYLGRIDPHHAAASVARPSFICLADELRFQAAVVRLLVSTSTSKLASTNAIQPTVPTVNNV